MLKVHMALFQLEQKNKCMKLFSGNDTTEKKMYLLK